MIINSAIINSSVINSQGSLIGVVEEVSSSLGMSSTSSRTVIVLVIQPTAFTFNTSTSGTSTLTTTYMETINSTLSFSLSGSNTLIVNVAVGNISFQDLLSTTLNDIQVVSSIVLNGQLSSTANVNNVITELLSLVQSALVSYQNVVSSNIAFSSNELAVPILVQTIEELISLSPTSSSIPILQSIVTSLITLNDVLLSGRTENVTSSLAITEVLTNIARYINEVSSTSVFSELASKTVVLLSIIDSPIDLSTILESSAIIKALLESTFVISLPSNIGLNEFATYLFSPESSSITEYNNYNFTGYAKHRNKYLMINDNGLYEYGGESDNGTEIDYNVLFPATSFDTSNLKAIPHIYLGTSLSGNLFLKVRLDGKGEFTYRVNKYTDGLETIQVDIGKGLVGRYFQFELIGSGTEFDLESIEFTPITLGRKI